MSETVINVPGRFNPIEYGTPLANASDIYDNNNEQSVQQSINETNSNIALQNSKITDLNTIGEKIYDPEGYLTKSFKIGDIFYTVNITKNIEIKNYYVAKLDGSAGSTVFDDTKFVYAGHESVKAINIKADIIKENIKGDDAYSVYVKQWLEDNPGLTPTQEHGFLQQDEWLDSLQGDDAYEIYYKTTTDNPKKTKSEWLISLKGQQGNPAYQPFKGTFGSTAELEELYEEPNPGDTAYVENNGIITVYDVLNGEWHNTEVTPEDYIVAVTPESRKYIDDNGPDLFISDENNNVLVSFEQGHVKTKNFDSSKIGVKTEVDNDDTIDLSVTDELGNSIAEFKDGHVRTKKFNSANIKESINEVTDTIQDIYQRVQRLETGIMDAESIIQSALTRATALFAPIGQAEISYEPKRTFKILFIGNSVTQDHVGYLPWLFHELYGNEVDFTIGNFYSGGRTIKNFVENFIIDENPETGLYSHTSSATYPENPSQNTPIWTQESNKTLLYAILQENWDFISIQAYKYTLTSPEDVSLTPALVSWLRLKATSSFELCYLMPQHFFGNKATQEEVQNMAKTIIKQNPVSLLFAPYYAIKEAVNRYGDIQPILSPSEDGTHLAEGLPVMITGMHIMQVICKRLGLKCKVINNKLVMTQAVWLSLNVPGPNPPASPQPDYSLNTDQNYEIAQICSVQGTKESESFYNECITELREELMSSITYPIIDPE